MDTFMFWNKNHELKPEYSWLKLPELFRNQPALMDKFYQELFTRFKHFQPHTNLASLIFEQAVFQQLKDPQFLAKRNQLLFGLPFLVKDNFAVKFQKTEAGSRILDNFIPNFDATVVALLTAKGMVLIGKTNMDELGMGGTGLESNRGFVKQSVDAKRITGGSSSGASVAIALNLAPVALASDTGNSVRLPASFVGIIGLKPTFGAISRFGLVPYSPSLDTVGIFTSSLRMMRIILEILSLNDPLDFAMQQINFLPPPPHHQKVAIIGLDQRLADPLTLQLFKRQILPRLEQFNYEYEIIQLDYELTSLLTFLYEVLSYPDALSSHANLTGFTFGLNEHPNRAQFDYNQTIIHNRTAGLGLEVKKRYVLGAFYVHEQNRGLIYQKALKMINFLKHRWMQRFAPYDFILHPASAGIAPLTKTVARNRLNPVHRPHLVDDYLLITNFLGWPSLVLPGFKIAKNWVGINLFTRAKNDLELLTFAQTIYHPKTGFQNE